MRYLVERSAIEQSLDLPVLRGQLGDLDALLKPSKAFPAASSTPRILVRLLDRRPGYGHLDCLYWSLERCLSAGWRHPRLLTTTDPGGFPSDAFEALLAAWLLNRGFEIESGEVSKRNDRVPDILVRRGDLHLRVEAYRPRDWEGLYALIDRLSKALENLDEPFDFTLRLEIADLARFIDGRLAWLDPWKLADWFEAPAERKRFVSVLVDEFTAALHRVGREAVVTREIPEANARITVSLESARSAARAFPDRTCWVHGPTLTGHAPEAMFERLSGRVLRKARKRQTWGDGDVLEALIVDVSALGCAPEFASHPYVERFAAAADRILADDRQPLDLIAFVRPRLLEDDFQVALVVESKRMDRRTAEAVLGCDLVPVRA